MARRFLIAWLPLACGLTLSGHAADLQRPEASSGPMCVNYVSRTAGVDATVEQVVAACELKEQESPSFEHLAKAVGKLAGTAATLECDLAQVYKWNIPAVLQVAALLEPVHVQMQKGMPRAETRPLFVLFIGKTGDGRFTFFDPAGFRWSLIQPTPSSPQDWNWKASLEQHYRKRALLVAFPPTQLPDEVRAAPGCVVQTPQAAFESVPKLKPPSLPEEKRPEDPLSARSFDLRRKPTSGTAQLVFEAPEAQLIEDLSAAEEAEANKERRAALGRLLRLHKNRFAALTAGQRVFEEAQALIKAGDYPVAAERLVFFEDTVDLAPQASLLALLALVGAEEDDRAMRLGWRLYERRSLRPNLLSEGLKAAVTAAARKGSTPYLLWCNAALIHVEPTGTWAGFAFRSLHRLLSETPGRPTLSSPIWYDPLGLTQD
ncbi:MAG: hypothetical protein FJ279_16135 [Planctomycetes bacterium]|nr:hypothetical protein [Planctomycetota bacterium]